MRRIGRAQPLDQRRHGAVRLDQVGEYRQQRVADVFQLAFADVEVEHAEEFAVRAGIGDQRLAARIGDDNGPRHGVMGMAAENNVDAGAAAGEFQIDIHAVMRQQHHHVGVLRVAQIVDQFLQLLLADAECPVGREAFRMGDRHIGKSLADDGDAHAADLLHRRRLEDAAGFRIERRLVAEGRVLGQKNILRQKLAFEAGEVLAQGRFAIGEFPMPGHGVDAEQVGGLDHVGALRRIGETGALPDVAAVEQQRIARCRLPCAAGRSRF